MPEAHSLFSASGAHGWMTCAGKILMETGRRTSSAYADEGTAAHELAATVLQERLHGRAVTARYYIGEKIRVEGEPGKVRTFTVDSDMAEHVDTYVDAFMARTDVPGAIRLIEQRVHYHTWLGVDQDEAFGTSDGVALVPLDADSQFWELQVDDLKYGAGVRVDAEENAQLRLYALGALYQFEEMIEGLIVQVRMTIHQPRKDHVSEEVLGVEELTAWAEEARAGAARVKDAEAAWAHADAQGLSLEEGLGTYLQPGDKACRFCDAKAICPALRAEVISAIRPEAASDDDFEDMTVDTPAEVADYGGNFLAACAAKLDLIDQWTKAVRAEIDRRVLLKGETIDGFKVVQGRMGNRKWREPGDIELGAQKLPAQVRELLFSRKLINPTQAEKALKGHPEIWAQLVPHITREQGAPAVVPVADPRPAFSRVTDDDFDTEPGPSAAGPGSHPFR